MYAIRMQLLGYGGAAFEGNLDEVQRLFRTGEASPTDRDGDGWTALLWASHGEQLHVVQWLLREGGSSIAEADNCDQTALLWAVYNLHAGTVQFLLRECGAGIADVEDYAWNVWGAISETLEARNAFYVPTPAELADLYSVLRCYGSPYDPTDFIEGLQCVMCAVAWSESGSERERRWGEVMVVCDTLQHGEVQAKRRLMNKRDDGLVCIHTHKPRPPSSLS